MIDGSGQAATGQALALSRAGGIVMESTNLAGRSILIVEDEPLIALDIRTAFENAGAIVMTARTLVDGVRLVEQDGLSAAVVDFGLGDGDADVLCGRLKELNIPFILHSGYGCISEGCHGGIVIPKPARTDNLIEAVVGLLH